jgi:hypothetical protein
MFMEAIFELYLLPSCDRHLLALLGGGRGDQYLVGDLGRLLMPNGVKKSVFSVLRVNGPGGEPSDSPSIENSLSGAVHAIPWDMGYGWSLHRYHLDLVIPAARSIEDQRALYLKQLKSMEFAIKTMPSANGARIALSTVLDHLLIEDVLGAQGQLEVKGYI